MRFLAILNRGGGTLRTLDLDQLVERMTATLAAAGHDLEAMIVDGEEIVDALDKAVAARNIDVVMVGGGDGTISAGAAVLSGTGKIMAVLPAGTMNLFARALGIPLDLDRAVEAFAQGTARDVDVAVVNGRVFVHQYSVGVHAKLVQLRERMDFRSKLGKMWASVRAALAALLRPPSMAVELEINDNVAIEAKTSGIGISNNLFGDGHLPYADDPAGGTLGIYIAAPGSRWEIFKLLAHVMLGRWNSSPHIEVREAQKVRLTHRRIRSRHKCVIDGELSKLERQVTIEIRPGALRVLAPVEQETGSVNSVGSAASG